MVTPTELAWPTAPGGMMHEGEMPIDDLAVLTLHDAGTTISGGPQRLIEDFYTYRSTLPNVVGPSGRSIIFCYAPRFIPVHIAGHMPRIMGQGFESYDSTTIGGEPDPTWLVAVKLGETLDEARSLVRRAERLVSRAEALHAARGAEDEDNSGDVVVFGTPKRVVPMRLQMIGSRRGVPLLAPEDLEE